jgi:zinc finger protein
MAVPSSTEKTSSTDFETVGAKAERLGAADANAEDDGKIVEEVESLCMNCHENVSRLSSPACQASCRISRTLLPC